MHREKQFIFIGKQGNDGNGNAPNQKELKILLLYIRPENALDESVTEEFEPDPFGHTRDELERLDKADFDWRIHMEDRIGG